MKKLGDRMKELGFNPNASQSVKEAFLKHLIQSQYGVTVQAPSEKKDVTPKSPPMPEQLSFSFEEANPNHTDKKVS